MRGIVIINPSLTPLPHPLQPSVGMPTRVSTSTSSRMADCLGERGTTVRLTVGGAHCSQTESALVLEDDETVLTLSWNTLCSTIKYFPLPSSCSHPPHVKHARCRTPTP